MIRTQTALHKYPDAFPTVEKLVELKKSIIKKLQEEDQAKTKSSKRLTVQEQPRKSITTFNLNEEIKLANGSMAILTLSLAFIALTYSKYGYSLIELPASSVLVTPAKMELIGNRILSPVRIIPMTKSDSWP